MPIEVYARENKRVVNAVVVNGRMSMNKRFIIVALLVIVAASRPYPLLFSIIFFMVLVFGRVLHLSLILIVAK